MAKKKPSKKSAKKPAKKPAKKSAKKKSSRRRVPADAATSEESLAALPPEFAAPPDIPVEIAKREFASLARLARSRGKDLLKIGIETAKVAGLGALAGALDTYETAWQRARKKVALGVAERKLIAEAEVLDRRLLSAGRWACRDDQAAQAELSRISEGSSLADTLQDLRDLVAFWDEHEDQFERTLLTREDLTRAIELADALETAAAKEEAEVEAAAALELRNRAFWAADALAGEIREGGRYAFQAVPKLAAQFVARHRVRAARRARRKKEAARSPEAAAPAVAAPLIGE
jgi:hypothetical protein